MRDNDVHLRWLGMAIDAATRGARQDQGGPFGAVVARGDQVLAEGYNQVLATNDPTAHAEVIAIRGAGVRLASPWLTGCTLYASCEPCPMCLGAAQWARIERIYFAATRRDAERAGFDDALFHSQLVRSGPNPQLELIGIPHPRAQEPFDLWLANPARRLY